MEGQMSGKTTRQTSKLSDILFYLAPWGGQIVAEEARPENIYAQKHNGKMCYRAARYRSMVIFFYAFFLNQYLSSLMSAVEESGLRVSLSQAVLFYIGSSVLSTTRSSLKLLLHG